jgi:Bacteriocin-protection, YdeI or OmpD-Associated/Domain of unknown function (DUF1905)
VPATTEQRFRAELRSAGDSGGAGFDVPRDVAAALSDAKRPPVTVAINGHAFSTRLAVYGGRPMVGVSKANRAAAGIAIGDAFDVAIALDTAPREIEVPPDLAEALAAEPAAAEAFDRLSYSHRREYVQWITEAKRPETRVRRVAGTLDRLRAGNALR